MRDMKFRGKRKDNGEWVTGSLIDKDYILQYIDLAESWTPLTSDHKITCRAYAVIPETVGQLTPLAERDGNDIYEGDTVKFHYFFQSLGENMGVQESEHEIIGNIVWGEFGWSIDAIRGQHWEGYTGYQRGEGECSILELYSMNQSSIHEESFEVIGNIHDVNPAVQDSVIISMDIEPKDQEVKDQPADAVAPEQATEIEQASAVTGQAAENAEEVTEG